ncbi:unnamed protein product [Paramecium pentaurelia]|uniref:MADS-box domain-containing protein n=1 Tax=Paramecium pentaurelia TaxID=43138 RepID=A0A8S1S1M6_9CILI|nr:unnamed protein product [Paramecium pentaurelia]
MGRKKIPITKIEDKQQRNITFHKRKIGLLKKAYELASLCGVQIYMVFNDLQGNAIHFRTEELNQIENNDKKKYLLTPKDYPKFITRSKTKVNAQLKDLPITPLKLVTDLMISEEPLFSRYSVLSRQFFPIPQPKSNKPINENNT